MKSAFLKLGILVSALCILSSCQWFTRKEALKFVIVDTLDRELFEELHIKDAINIPYVSDSGDLNPAYEKAETLKKEIEKKADGLLDANTKLFFYCADEMCTSSKIAADLASAWGYNADEYDSGLKGWLALSLWAEDGQKYELEPAVNQAQKFKNHTYLNSILEKKPDEVTLKKWQEDARAIIEVIQTNQTAA